MRKLLCGVALVSLIGSVPVQTPAQRKISWMPSTQFTDGTPIPTSVTYILYKRAGAAAPVELLRKITNQHSRVEATAPLAAGDCVHVVADVVGERSEPSVEACLGKTPKAATALDIE